ncbi:MAG: hypothetical protein OXH99_00670 [Bryobacterales bacterium]|nr:hypothetical protein [Bryobacterales bacterium]
MTEAARRGWDSTFPQFRAVRGSRILARLCSTYPDSSQEEVDSWRRNVPTLQREVGEVVRVRTDAGEFTAVMEYELPMESRRADVVLLLRDGVVVVELKGKFDPSDADVDQAHAYARDLACYHRDCHNRPVHPVLVPCADPDERARPHGTRRSNLCPRKPRHAGVLAGWDAGQRANRRRALS